MKPSREESLIRILVAVVVSLLVIIILVALVEGAEPAPLQKWLRAKAERDSVMLRLLLYPDVQVRQDFLRYLDLTVMINRYEAEIASATTETNTQQ